MTRLLMAASGTGGHLFPALAIAEQLPDYEIEWLGVPDRLEQTLVPKQYRLHSIPIEGFQGRFSLKTLIVFARQLWSVVTVYRLLRERQIEIICTTGGYIAAPTILAAFLAKVPVIFHESNSIPGKVTRWLGPWCDTVALGFKETASYLPRAKTVWMSTPVRSQFLAPQALDLPIPEEAFLIVVVGGSQGAVAMNRLVRQAALSWLEQGVYLVHLTGDKDSDIHSLQHPHYFALPFYDNMAGLLQRANLAISRSGAGSVTELAITHTPSILIPYPFAAEDHQFYNAKVFAEAGAAYLYRQEALSPEILANIVSELRRSPSQLAAMADCTTSLVRLDSAEQLANLIRRRTRS